MSRITIIAEAGVNHNGNPALARELIDVAASAGADIVKFQTFRAERLVTKKAEKAAYQKSTTGGEQSQFDMLKKLELSPDVYIDLARYCTDKNITFLSTPFDPESMDFLINETRMETIKVPSGEVVNGPLLLHAAKSGKKIIMSTGMCNLAEIKTALSVLAFGYTEPVAHPSTQAFEKAFASSEGQQKLKEKLVLLHCTSDYPAPYNDINLNAMQTMRTTFGLPVGLSDHSKGTVIPVAAAALGAVVIEKHFTLDTKMAGPDHQASLAPDDLHRMIADIRATEAALGSGDKISAQSEQGNRNIVRGSVTAKESISKGELFSHSNLTIKRPGNGLSPMMIFDLIGRSANRSYQRDEMIDL